jgi:hypothetical protein
MRNLRIRLAVLLCSTLCLLTGANGQLAAPILIVDPIDTSKRIVLPGNTRPEVREFGRGPDDASFPLNGMQFQLRRSPKTPASFRNRNVVKAPGPTRWN